MHNIRLLWSSHKIYRILLSATLIYAALRLLIHVVYISGLLIAGDQAKLAIPADLAVYIDAARHLQQGQPLYLDPSSGVKSAFPYLYSPTFAILFGWLFLWLPPMAIAFAHTLLHLAAYFALYMLWDRLLQSTHQARSSMLLALSLPLWLIYAPFWSDLLLLNVRVFITLLVIALIAALLAERLRPTVVLVVLILLLKPQWACVLALPLLLGRWRFGLKAGALSAAAYAAIGALTILALGPSYGIQQYRDYARLLMHVGAAFPWDIAGAGIIGPNHSLAQMAVSILGVTPAAFRAAAVLKLALLLPLIAVALRFSRNRKHPAIEAPIASLDLALLLCLGGYIALDLVWADDFFLGMMIVPYLLAAMLPTAVLDINLWSTSRVQAGLAKASISYLQKLFDLFVGLRLGLWLLFLLYALVDFLRLAGFAALGPNVMIVTPYIELARTDPSIYLPLAMILILACYILLLARLWVSKPSVQSAHIDQPGAAHWPASLSTQAGLSPVVHHVATDK